MKKIIVLFWLASCCCVFGERGLAVDSNGWVNGPFYVGTTNGYTINARWTGTGFKYTTTGNAYLLTYSGNSFVVKWAPSGTAGATIGSWTTLVSMGTNFWTTPDLHSTGWVDTKNGVSGNAYNIGAFWYRYTNGPAWRILGGESTALLTIQTCASNAANTLITWTDYKLPQRLTATFADAPAQSIVTRADITTIPDVTNWGANTTNADNYAYFQAAINSLTNGGTIYVPVGVWHLSQGLTNGNPCVTIQGCGSGYIYEVGPTNQASILMFDGGTYAFQSQGVWSGINAGNYTTLKDLRFDCNSAINGVVVSGSDRIDSITVMHSTGFGIYSPGQINSTKFERIACIYNAGEGQVIDNTSTTTLSIMDSTWRANQGIGLDIRGGYKVDIGGHSVSEQNGEEGLKLFRATGNYLNRFKISMWLEANGTNVASPYKRQLLIDAGTASFSTVADGIEFNNCYINSRDSTTNDTAILVNAGQNISFVKCDIVGPAKGLGVGTWTRWITSENSFTTQTLPLSVINGITSPMGIGTSGQYQVYKYPYTSQMIDAPPSQMYSSVGGLGRLENHISDAVDMSQSLPDWNQIQWMTLTTNACLGPDGVYTNGASLTATNTSPCGASWAVLWGTNDAVGTIWIKAGSATLCNFGISVRTNNGGFGYPDGIYNVGTASDDIVVGTNWQRYVYYRHVTNAYVDAISLNIRMLAPTVGDKIYIAMPQIEKGYRPGPFTPTYGTAVTTPQFGLLTPATSNSWNWVTSDSTGLTVVSNRLTVNDALYAEHNTNGNLHVTGNGHVSGDLFAGTFQVFGASVIRIIDGLASSATASVYVTNTTAGGASPKVALKVAGDVWGESAQFSGTASAGNLVGTNYVKGVHRSSDGTYGITTNFVVISYDGSTYTTNSLVFKDGILTSRTSP